jgi:hypothetical protein
LLRQVDDLGFVAVERAWHAGADQQVGREIRQQDRQPAQCAGGLRAWPHLIATALAGAWHDGNKRRVFAGHAPAHGAMRSVPTLTPGCGMPLKGRKADADARCMAGNRGALPTTCMIAPSFSDVFRRQEDRPHHVEWRRSGIAASVDHEPNRRV